MPIGMFSRIARARNQTRHRPARDLVSRPPNRRRSVLFRLSAHFSPHYSVRSGPTRAHTRAFGPRATMARAHPENRATEPHVGSRRQPIPKYFENPENGPPPSNIPRAGGA